MKPTHDAVTKGNSSNYSGPNVGGQLQISCHVYSFGREARDFSQMFDLIAPLIFLAFVLYLAYIAIVKEYLPNYVAEQVRIAPLDKELQHELLKIHSFTAQGLKIGLKGIVLKSRLEYERLSIRIIIPSIQVYTRNQSLLGTLYLSNPVLATGKNDFELDQELEFIFNDNISTFLPTIRRISAIGPTELEKVKLLIKFKLTLETPLVTLVDIPW